jgi:hypothetical protein
LNNEDVKKRQELEQELNALKLQMKQKDKEMERLQEQGLCMVCFVEPINSAFMPCGHRQCCEGCARQLMGRGDRCPFCRARIEDVLRTFG